MRVYGIVSFLWPSRAQQSTALLLRAGCVLQGGDTLRARIRRASSSASSGWAPPRESGRAAPLEATTSGSGGSADGDRSSPADRVHVV